MRKALLTIALLSVGAPDGWRHSIEGAFSLFLPPAVKRVGPKTFDSIAGEFAGRGVTLRYDYGFYAPECGPGAEAGEIGGRAVKLERSEAPDGGPKTLIACFAPSRPGAKRLTVRAEALGETAADVAEAAVRTIRFR
jgi:hypothetical protein